MKTINDHPGMRAWYFGLVAEAYAAEAERLKGDLPSKADWRRKVNLDATGFGSIRQMNQSSDFDKVMLELAIIAGNDKQISRFITGNERRLRRVIQWMIEDLEYLEKRSIEWTYIQGICKQAKYSTSLMDCPEEHLANIMKMVDTHVRRLAKKADIARADLPSAYKRKGRTDEEAKALWHHDHHHHITHKQGAAA